MDEQDFGDDEYFECLDRLEARIKNDGFRGSLTPSVPVTHDPFFSYSPPRELSQRVGGFSNALVDYSNPTVTAKPISPTSSSRRCDNEKDLEINRLKKRAGTCLNKHLLELENECSQLKKGRTKETLSKNLSADNKGQCSSTVHASKGTNLEPAAIISAGQMDEQDFGDDEYLECLDRLEARIKNDGFRGSLTPSVPVSVPTHDPFFSYSPPRELSQRVGGFSDALVDYSNPTVTAKPISTTSSSRRCDNEKDLEINPLKKRAGTCLNKHLPELENECSQLKKGRTKETLSKNLSADNKGQCSSTVHASKVTNL